MATIDLFNYGDKETRESVPSMELSYKEADTGNYWLIWASAADARLYRIGDKLDSVAVADRIMDADLMVRRLETSLLIAKRGLFQLKFDAMWTLQKVQVEEGTSGVNCVLRRSKTHDKDNACETLDWFGAFSKFTLLRRAAEDAYMASVLQQESIFFLYRGFEWLKKAVGDVPWHKLGPALDLPQENIEYIKRVAHDQEAASRHAADTGFKNRFGSEICSSWVCGLFHAIAVVRCRIDAEFDGKVKESGNPWPI